MSNKINRRNFVKAAVAGAATTAAIPSIANAKGKKMRLKMQSWWGKEADPVFDQFIDNIKIGTEGNIRIKRYQGGAIVPDAEMVDAVSKGTLDMCEGYGGYWPGKVDMAMLESGMPGAWSTYEQADWLFRNGLSDLVAEAYAEMNIKYLGVILGGPFDLLTKEPVTKLADLKKMKIRATPAMAKILQKFDIPTVFIPGSELYIALSTGAIDGLIYGGPMEYVNMKLYEVAKHYTKLNILHPGFTDCMLVNMDKWKSMSEADQKVMELAYEAHAGNMYAFMMDGMFNPKYTDKFEFAELPAEESKQMREAGKALWEEAAQKSERMKKAIEILNTF